VQRLFPETAQLGHFVGNGDGIVDQNIETPLFALQLFE
jgi:hypothetical protein